LDENRNKYLNIGHSLSKGNDMTERDRDEIDREAQLYIDETNRRLNQIRKILGEIRLQIVHQSINGRI
jgi:hypothetical protein